MNKSIIIVGAGPVGSLLAIYMARRGYEVSVFEKRSDPRKAMLEDGRSINIALSHRGIHALQKAGIGTEILKEAIPMHGRMVHDNNGVQRFHPYGKEGQYINSISRGGLNRTIIERAERDYSIKFFFDHKCTGIDFEKKTISLVSLSKETKSINYSILAATDGAFSTIRAEINLAQKLTSEINKLSHGYKELTIPPIKQNDHAIEKGALHIWPRGNFMLIALPNKDGSFTCTIFLPYSGDNSFEEINTKEKLHSFFKANFPDVLPLLKNVEQEYFAVEPSSLSTVHTYPWVYKDVFLIGDAAHAMVPFYGQGMNAGFEDVRVLDELLTLYQENWDEVLPRFQESRKPNTDAITAMAMQNFVEMRDLVDDEDFIIRKKIEAAIHEKYKSYWPLYSMVTFSDMPYEEALIKGEKHDALMSDILSLPNIKETWESEKGWSEIETILKGRI